MAKPNIYFIYNNNMFHQLYYLLQNFLSKCCCANVYTKSV